jgi:flagellar hook assembly protein FlgD
MKIQDNSENNQNGITIYPNPTKSEVFVSMSNIEETKVNIQVVDASGKIVYENRNLDVTNGLANFTLNVKNGIYFVHVVALSDSQVKIEKLIINK